MSVPAGVPGDDRGLTLGVGLFETLFVRDGRPAHWTAHLDRLARGCARLGLPSPASSQAQEAGEAALAASGLAAGLAVLRLTWTGGGGGRGLAVPASPEPRLLAIASPWSEPPPALRLATSAIRRNAFSPASRLKTLSYLDNVAARAEAVAAGAAEALMLNTSGMVACAAAGNVFWVEGEALVTPTLKCGVLDGIVRELALSLAPRFGYVAKSIGAPVEALRRAQGAFVTNSLVGAVPISTLDGRPLPPPDTRLACLISAIRDQAWSTTGSRS